ncbi:DUF6886 family protein [Amycolatopsis sp. NPDC051045]|uniref:DUF6886 family protein n=1 Tax=Amycolatopsis sp. NPDC051045 TaxID=3156922 RepID=UPI00342ADA91
MAHASRARQCPRGTAWVAAGTSADDRSRIVGPGSGSRVHAIEYGWLEAMWTVRLFAYRFPASAFEPFGEHRHAMVAVTPAAPLGPPEPVGDLLALHASAGIQLRVLANLWDFVDAAAASSSGSAASGWGTRRLGGANCTRDVSRGTVTAAAG